MLSDKDIERARYHLGYMTVTVASSYAFGVPQSTETQFLFEDAIRRVMPESETRVLRILSKLDEIEETLFCSTKELFAKRVGDLEQNLNQPDDVEREYGRWAGRLADMLGVMPYPYSDRFKLLRNGGGTAGNMRMRR